MIALLGRGQVHPKLMTELLWRKAQENGASHHVGKIEDVKIHTPATGQPEVAAVIVDGEEIPAKNVVVAMGPWSGPFLWKFLHPSDSIETYREQALKRRRSPRSPSPTIVKGQKAYSIVLRYRRSTFPYEAHLCRLDSAHSNHATLPVSGPTARTKRATAT